MSEQLNVTIPAYLPNLSEEEKRKLGGLLFTFGNIRRRACMMEVEGRSRSEIIKKLREDTGFNSWYVLNAYDSIKGLPKMGVVFGGKRNKRLLDGGKISKKEFHRRRNSFIASRGEKMMSGNRCLRVVWKDGKLKLRVTTGIRGWIYLDLFVPRKYLGKYGHLLGGSKPYKVTIKRRENGNYDVRITVHPEAKRKEMGRVLAIDTNSGHLDWVVVERGSKRLIDSGRMNTPELNASSNKTENLLYELVRKIGNIAQHYGAEVIIGKLNTGKFSSPNSKLNRKVKSIPHYKLRKMLKYKLALRGIPFKAKSEKYTSIVGKKIGEGLGLDIHKGSAYAFALKAIDYKVFKLILHGVLSNENDGSRGQRLNTGSWLTATIQLLANGHGNERLDGDEPGLRPDKATPQHKVGAAPPWSSKPSFLTGEVCCGLP